MDRDADAILSGLRADSWWSPRVDARRAAADNSAADGFAEAFKTARVFSAAGLLGSDAIRSERPFRPPHHSMTVAGH